MYIDIIYHALWLINNMMSINFWLKFTFLLVTEWLIYRIYYVPNCPISPSIICRIYSVPNCPISPFIIYRIYSVLNYLIPPSIIYRIYSVLNCLITPSIIIYRIYYVPNCPITPSINPLVAHIPHLLCTQLPYNTFY